MQLTRFSDYALRTLMYLAVAEGSRACAADVAAAYGISAGHVGKVVAALAAQGLVRTRRGRDGGFELAQPPDAIRVGAVLRATESGSPLVECLDPATDTCRITPVCGLRHALRAATEAFFRELDGVTLADLVRKRSQVATLLSLGPPRSQRARP